MSRTRTRELRSRDVLASIAIVLFLGLCLGLVSSMSSEQAEATQKARPLCTAAGSRVVTLQGRIIDLAHLMTGDRAMEGSPEDGRRSTPLALDTEHGLYIVLRNAPGGLARLLESMIGSEVEVMGSLFEKKGLSLLRVERLKRIHRG